MFFSTKVKFSLSTKMDPTNQNSWSNVDGGRFLSIFSPEIIVLCLFLENLSKLLSSNNLTFVQLLSGVRMSLNSSKYEIPFQSYRIFRVHEI